MDTYLYNPWKLLFIIQIDEYILLCVQLYLNKNIILLEKSNSIVTNDYQFVINS